jgi:5-methylcytosine-specific restriction endonuclease McrA
MPHPKRRIINSCVICDAKFEVQLSTKDKKITCSKECSSKNKSYKRLGGKHNIGPKYNECVRCKTAFLINGVNKKSKTAKYCSPKCQNQDHSERISGEKSHNWKGGVADTNKRSQFKREIYEWRKLVFKRDFYKCQHCGSKKELEAHHIIEWSKCVETRFDLNNGLTLCIICHGKVHNTNFGPRVVKKCIDCKTPVVRKSKRCIPCYYLARKNKIIVNR